MNVKQPANFIVKMIVNLAVSMRVNPFARRSVNLSVREIVSPVALRIARMDVKILMKSVRPFAKSTVRIPEQKLSVRILAK